MGSIMGSNSYRYKDPEIVLIMCYLPVFIPVISRESQVEEVSNSFYTATESFTHPGDCDLAPLCLQLHSMIRINH